MKDSKRAYKLRVAFQGKNQIEPRFVGPPNFLGGRNVDWSKNMATGGMSGISKNQCLELTNYDIDEAGILVSRLGFTNKGPDMLPDILDEPFDNLTKYSWINDDNGNAVSEISPAGQLRLDTNTSGGQSGRFLSGAVTSGILPPDKFTLEIKTYFDVLGTKGPPFYADGFYFQYGNATWMLNVFFSSNELCIVKAGGVATTQVGAADIVKCNATAAWQTWRFQVNKTVESTATVEVFLKEEGGIWVSQGTFDCDYERGYNGLYLSQRGITVNNMVAHIDYIKIGTGLGEFLDSTLTVHSMYRYYKTSTATAYHLAQIGTQIGTFVPSTGIFTALATGLAEVPLKWLTWNDMAYAFNGTGIYKFDGTTWTQVQSIDPDCPDAIDGVVLDDVLFAARDGATYPSRVLYSAEFNAEDWTATHYRRVSERDGHSIMSMIRIGSKIACLKDLSIWILNGSSKYDFSEEKLTSELGQVGRMASALCADKFFFQSGRGIEYFDPSSPQQFNCISRGTCSNEIVNNYTRAEREAAVMCYWPKKDRLFVSYPTLTVPTIYVFFLKHPKVTEDNNIWFPHSIYTGITATSFMIANAPADEETLYIGTDEGQILQYGTGYDDNSAAVTGTMQWGYTNDKDMVHVKDWSRLVLPGDIAGTFTAELDVDYGKKTSSKSTPAYTDTDAAEWDSAIWDTSEWAISTVRTKITRFLKMKGISAAIKLTGVSAGRQEIHPFLLEYYPLEIRRQI